jgi:ATP/maltotriose-dependent transcriptional regulator MalT
LPKTWLPVPRARLTALLAESALTSVELLIAPPGYGKSIVLREYAGSDPDVAFVAFQEDTDLESFVREVIAAAVPSALRSIGALFESPDDRSVEDRAADWLVSRLHSFGGTVIVDDFHRAAADDRVARVLAATVAATHGRVRWIVSSREAPRFPMGSWIARGWMGLPITGEDLAFTLDEAGTLAASLDIAVDADELASIVEDTVGWPIGVRIALGLLARKRGPSQARVQTREALFALLRDEVWQPLDEDLRALVSAAAMMPAPSISTLIAAGFAEARADVIRACARIPFIQPLDDDAFAIHDLFREFVTTQTPRESRSGGEVANRTGAALVAGGNAAHGLPLLMRAGNVDAVRDALARYAFDLLETGRRAVVTAALAFFDDRGHGDDGVALAIRGALAFADGSGSNATNLLARALGHGVPAAMRCEVTRRLALSYVNHGDERAALGVLLPAASDPAFTAGERFEMQAFCLAVRAALGERDGIPAAIEDIEAALPSVAPAAQTRILQRLSNATFCLGDLEAAERFAHASALLATELSMDGLAATCYGILYSIAAHVDDNALRARTFLSAQATAAERVANTSLRVYALRAEFILAAVNGETDAARKVETLLARLADTHTYRDAFVMRHGRAMLHLVSGDIRKAEATLASISPAAMTPAEQAFRDALLVVLTLARGDREAAARSLERGLLAEAAGDYLSRSYLDYAHALRAVAFWMLDRPQQARRVFAFDAGWLPQRDRTLVDALRALTEFRHPLPNRDAVSALCRDLEQADFSAYAALVRRLVNRDANEVALSATEIETLRFFDRYGGRATDVARVMGKSKYTVQNQIQSAIKKIGCSGRSEALAYARQRGWLDSDS